MRALLWIVAALALLCVAPPAGAQEAINRFDVRIGAERGGGNVVSEAINVTAEGDQIRRGIFRDLPRYYESDGARVRYQYDVLGVSRNGRDEPYETSADGNAFRIRIGDPDVLIEHGAHQYELCYRVRNQVRYFDSYDELYWNVTGTYCAFPIRAARATIVLPAGGRVTQYAD